MSDTYAIYAVSDDDQPVIDALTATFAFPGVDDPAYDDGKTVTFTVPGRQAVMWRGDSNDLGESAMLGEKPVRQIFLWGGGGTTVQVGLDVIDSIRGHGIPVFVDPENADLIAADAERT